MTTPLDVIAAIRKLGQLMPSDVAAITAALSCQIASDANSHIPLHSAAIDSLDDLHLYITDSLEEA